MRTKTSEILERGRVRTGELASDESYGMCGAFNIGELRLVANDSSEPSADGWEHVSVSLDNRTPTWEEMCYIKQMFWEDNECVIQFHPPRSKHINIHPNCLHLWRNTRQKVRLPPSRFV